MFKITKRTINSSNTVLYTKESYLDCSKLDLEAVIIPKLQKLVNLYNLNNSVNGQNLHIDIVIEKIEVYNALSYMGFIIERIKDFITNVNKTINTHNKLAKMSNRRNSRVIDSNLLKEVKLEDYINSDIADIRKFECSIIIK